MTRFYVVADRINLIVAALDMVFVGRHVTLANWWFATAHLLLGLASMAVVWFGSERICCAASDALLKAIGVPGAVKR